MSRQTCERCSGSGMYVNYGPITYKEMGIVYTCYATCMKCNGIGSYDEDTPVNGVPMKFIKKEFWDGR